MTPPPVNEQQRLAALRDYEQIQSSRLLRSEADRCHWGTPTLCTSD